MKHFWRVGLLAGIVFSVATISLTAYGQTSAVSPLTSQLAKALCDRYLEARNTPNLALLDEVYATDVVAHEIAKDIAGLDALKTYYTRSHTAFPDLKLSLDRMVLADNDIIWFWTFAGTNTGPLDEMPPTGKSVRFSGVAVDRVVNGKFAEERIYFNLLDLMTQLGFTLMPPSPPK